jgi:hypothetical protein
MRTASLIDHSDKVVSLLLPPTAGVVWSEYEKRLKNMGVKIGVTTREILSSEYFLPLLWKGNRFRVDMVFTQGLDLPNIESARDFAVKTVNFSKIQSHEQAEVALLLHLYASDILAEVGITRFLVDHEPIPDIKGYNRVLGTVRDGYMDGCSSNEHSLRSVGGGFAIALVRKV